MQYNIIIDTWLHLYINDMIDMIMIFKEKKQTYH